MKTIGELIARNESHYPNRCAFVMHGGARRTYGEYADRVRRLASGLRNLGLRSQDRVGCLSMNRLEYFELYGACEQAGYILANYNFRLAPPEIAHLLADSAPKIIVFETQYASSLAIAKAQSPGIRDFICLDGPVPEWALAYEDVVRGANPEEPPLVPRPEDFVYLFYTSGTTGRPKGVPWTQRGALEAARMQGRLLDSDIRVLTSTPAFHVGGKTMPLAALWHGGTTILQRGFSPRAWLAAVAEERVTDTFMVAPMVQAVLDFPDFEQYDRSSLKSIMAAAAPIPADLLRRALAKFGPAFYVAYGSTESGTIAQLERHELRPDGTPEERKRLRSVGHFCPEVEATILDDEGGSCRPGETGEVCLKSMVFEGYWNNSIATIEAMRGGWFHTGDLAYSDEQGFVYLVDRKNDMIVSGGENIYSREVEDALLLHPAICEAAVIGMLDVKWGESVQAVLVMRSGFAPSEAEILEHCRSLIAGYKCPKSFVFAAALPRSATGKIDKVALRKQYTV